MVRQADAEVAFSGGIGSKNDDKLLHDELCVRALLCTPLPHRRPRCFLLLCHALIFPQSET
jgi:hypothetical protein